MGFTKYAAPPPGRIVSPNGKRISSHRPGVEPHGVVERPPVATGKARRVFVRAAGDPGLGAGRDVAPEREPEAGRGAILRAVDPLAASDVERKPPTDGKVKCATDDSVWATQGCLKLDRDWPQLPQRVVGLGDPERGRRCYCDQ